MSIYIDSANRIIHDQEQHLAIVCPHCQVTAHITPLAIPRFADLQESKPRKVGAVYRCDACLSPVFLRFTTRVYSASRIELAPQFEEVERAREKFTFTYLPEEVEVLFREALICFSAGAFNAFASMCRRTAQGVFADLGETGKLRLFDQLNDIRDMAELEGDTFNKLKSLVFGNDTDARQGPNPPLFDAQEASVVLEVMKDLLYEAYVRKGKLQQAITVRRFFVDETATRLTALSEPDA